MIFCTGQVRAHCNDKDVRAVLLKRKVEGGQVFDGAPVLVCARCRRAMQGQFKYAPPVKAVDGLVSID